MYFLDCIFELLLFWKFDYFCFVFSNHNELMSVEEEDYPPASANVSESLISDVHDVSSRVIPEYSESKQETDLPPGYQQYSTVHAYPNYGFGIMPSMVGSQVLPTESTKSQTHDVSRLPAFVVSLQDIGRI